jgi:hypothetical protein
VSFPKTTQQISVDTSTVTYFIGGSNNALRVAHTPTGATLYGGFSNTALESVYIPKTSANNNGVGLFN